MTYLKHFHLYIFNSPISSLHQRLSAAVVSPPAVLLPFLYLLYSLSNSAKDGPPEARTSPS